MANHIFNTYKVKLDGNTVIQSDSDGAFKIYNGDDDTLQADVIAMSNNIVTNSTNISAETSNRVSADTSLSTEVSTNLSSEISTEASARTSADTSLESNITMNSTNISTETSNRVSADSSLSTEVSTNLSSSISSEESNRISSDVSLSTEVSTNLFTEISTEGSTRESVDVSLSTEVSTESSTRLSADTSLEALINTNDTFATGVALSAADQFKTVTWSNAGKSWGAGTPKAMGTLRSATDGAAILAVQTSGCDATSATFVFSDDMPDGTYTLDVFAAV